MKKAIFAIAAVIISGSAHADLPVSKGITARACDLVAAEARRIDPRLSAITAERCIESANLTMEEEYDPRGPNVYKIFLDISDLPELEETEQWLACELTAEDPVDSRGVEVQWCSIEG